MPIPTKAELNGRTLYTVLAHNSATSTTFVAYAGTDEARARELARNYGNGVVIAGQISYDAREMGEE